MQEYLNKQTIIYLRKFRMDLLTARTNKHYIFIFTICWKFSEVNKYMKKANDLEMISSH